MKKEAFGTGSTIEEAQKNAAFQLGAGENADIQYEVIEMPVKKTFGLFGGSPAKVKAYYEISPAEMAESYLRDVLSGMGVSDASLTSQEIENGVSFMIDCEDNSAIIGRHGETLDALQYLTGLVANRGDEDYFRVSVNTGNYREKREKSLFGYARKMAFQVIKTGKSVVLDPMNPYERRIIHTAVQGVNGATSHSTGEGSERKVVICLEEGFKPTGARYGRGGDRRFNQNRSGGYKKGGRGFNKKFENKNRSFAAPEKETREPRSDFDSAPLYGKVDS